MTITALQLLKAAQQRGWTMKVWAADDPDYIGTSATAAWEAVKATEEATVTFHSASGQRIGAAFLMAPGPNSCAPDETLVDHSCPGGEFEALWRQPHRGGALMAPATIIGAGIGAGIAYFVSTLPWWRVRVATFPARETDDGQRQKEHMVFAEMHWCAHAMVFLLTITNALLGAIFVVLLFGGGR